MPANLTLTVESIAAGLVGIGGVVLLLKNWGWITFGTPTERRKCAEVCGAHDKLENKVNDIDSKLDQVIEGVAEISGFLQGRNGFKG